VLQSRLLPPVLLLLQPPTLLPSTHAME